MPLDATYLVEQDCYMAKKYIRLCHVQWYLMNIYSNKKIRIIIW